MIFKNDVRIDKSNAYRGIPRDTEGYRGGTLTLLHTHSVPTLSYTPTAIERISNSTQETFPEVLNLQQAHTLRGKQKNSLNNTVLTLSTTHSSVMQCVLVCIVLVYCSVLQCYLWMLQWVAVCIALCGSVKSVHRSQHCIS